MKTYLGLEVNYCQYCKTHLIAKKVENKFFAVCPKRDKYLGLVTDIKHSSFYLGEENNKHYDAETGKPL